MIEFKQKYYSEYDAMKSFYEELKKIIKTNKDFPKVEIIDSSALIPVLKGNNIVIERFVISTSFGSKDKYRMYLKIGAGAKMPDEVRLPSDTIQKRLLGLKFNINAGLPGRKFFSENGERLKLFADKNVNSSNSGSSSSSGSSGSSGNIITSSLNLEPQISYIERELKGKTLKYDKKERSLVLEFNDIESAIKSLVILPFGLNYKIYLLDA